MHKSKRNWKKIIIITLSSVFAVILIAGITALIYMNGMLDKIQYAPAKAANLNLGGNVPSSSSQASSSKDQTESLNQISTPVVYDKDVFNVLLIGYDARNTSNAGRSDSMIVISINKKTNKIIMTSMMRDIYLSIPGYGNNRMNAAYSYGGADLLLRTITQNFGIKIDKYISVNFFTFMDIIDKLGGVNIDVSEAELPVLNDYVKEINQIEGLDPNNGVLTKSGSNIHLTGKQAMGYSRIRYVGPADFGRTQRQRSILTQIFNKLKSQNIIELNNLLNILLPDVTTNLSKGELISLVLSSPVYLAYPMVEDRIPIDGSYKGQNIHGMDVLTVDFSKNINEMQSKIYK